MQTYEQWENTNISKDKWQNNTIYKSHHRCNEKTFAAKSFIYLCRQNSPSKISVVSCPGVDAFDSISVFSVNPCADTKSSEWTLMLPPYNLHKNIQQHETTTREKMKNTLKLHSKLCSLSNTLYYTLKKKQQSLWTHSI